MGARLAAVSPAGAPPSPGSPRRRHRCSSLPENRRHALPLHRHGMPHRHHELPEHPRPSTARRWAGGCAERRRHLPAPERWRNLRRRAAPRPWRARKPGRRRPRKVCGPGSYASGGGVALAETEGEKSVEDGRETGRWAFAPGNAGPVVLSYARRVNRGTREDRLFSGVHARPRPRVR